MWNVISLLWSNILELLSNKIFWCAFLGTIGKELLSIHKALRTRARLPKHKYMKIHYLVVLLLALFSGWLTVGVLGVDNPVLATITGFAILIIMENFAEGKVA